MRKSHEVHSKKEIKILGFIPARGGSKGIPKKNIYPLNGKPLIAYTIEAARKSKINRIVASTDSREIADVVVHYGAEAPFLRPAELAADTSTVWEAVRYTLKRLEDTEHYRPDIIILLHPTAPLRTSQHIDEGIELLSEKKAEGVVSVSHPMEHPAEMVYWDDQGNMRFLLNIDRKVSQRQQYPQCYFLNGALYVFKCESLLKNKNWLDMKIFPYIMKQIDSIDIDSMDNLKIAEAILKTWKR